MTGGENPPPRIAFRTDASIQIGTGHVMRCLTLADALARQGAACVFISRAHGGNLNRLIAARGHEVIALPAPAGAEAGAPGAEPAHARWLGTGWACDAEQTRQTLGGRHVDWLVVDHYALDARWEEALRPACRKLMVIDDLADRPHECDLLLDQNLGRAAAHYLALTPPGCTRLVGPQYALLRPEFSDLRDESLARRRPARLQHLLITLGGVDKDNVTGKLLDALRGCCQYLPADLRITVIMGPHAPWRDAVQALAAQMPWPTQVAVGVSDMARRMAAADLAIGAAGSTSWERCCLGVPSITAVLADNQREVAQKLEAMEAVWLVAANDLHDTLRDILRSIAKDTALLSAASQRSAQIVDGRGCDRVAAQLIPDWRPA